MLPFARKAVIITGASSGIGRAAALAFAKDGAKLTITGRDKAQLGQVAEECRQFKGCEVHHITSDLSTFENLKSIVDQTVEKFQKIDVLVNNSDAPATNATKIPLAKDHVFNTNLKAPVFLSKFALPHLKKSKGCVINVSIPRSATHSSEKHLQCLSQISVNHFMKRFAAENASSGVRAYTVNRTAPASPNASDPIPVDEFAKAISFMSGSNVITGSSVFIDK